MFQQKLLIKKIFYISCSLLYFLTFVIAENNTRYDDINNATVTSNLINVTESKLYKNQKILTFSKNKTFESKKTVKKREVDMFSTGQLNNFQHPNPIKSVSNNAYDNYWGRSNSDGPSPDIQLWQNAYGSIQSVPQSISYPQPQSQLQSQLVNNYGIYNKNTSPYAGYLEKQILSYPIMIYTLNDCIPCRNAKQLLAQYYSDVHAHFLELSGNEPWQQQLQVDLQYLTGAATFPYIFVCGRYIGGQSDLFELHESGQLRQLVSQCLKTTPKKL